MSQYEQLYTLKCSPSIIHKDSHTIDLLPCDTAGNLLTRPQIDEADEPAAYSISIDDAGQTLHVVDPVTQTKLSTVSSSAPNKLRHVQLHNPETIVEFKNKTLLSFEWKFEWEDMRFAWNRSRDTLSTRDSGYTLKLGRKPDPDIAVAQYKLHKRGNLIQIFDYNLSRLTIKDRKGFEIVLLSTLFSIVEADKLDELGRSSSAVAQNSSSASQSGSNAAAAGSISKSPSPRPTLNGRLDSADDDEVETAEPNEVLVSTRLPESAYVEHCLALLSDPNLIYLSLIASSADAVPRAVSIASEVKRKHTKSSKQKEDLMQYIDYPGRSTVAPSPTPDKKTTTSSSSSRRGSSSNTNTPRDKPVPPEEIVVYLSRIPLQEFATKSSSTSKRTENVSGPTPSTSTSAGRARPAAHGSSSEPHHKISKAPPLPPKSALTAAASSGSPAGDSSASRGRSFWQKITSA